MGGAKREDIGVGGYTWYVAVMEGVSFAAVCGTTRSDWHVELTTHTRDLEG